MQKVARKCYLPANEKMLELIERFDGQFKVAYSITGIALEQMHSYAPDVIESFQKLVATGCVELLAETYHHSLCSIYDAAVRISEMWYFVPLAVRFEAEDWKATVLPSPLIAG